MQTILSESLKHYQDAFNAGKVALGTTQYPDGGAGLAAFNDPNSNASMFRDWRTSSKVEQDVSTYLDAFKAADVFYNADNEPPAISNWRDDMGTLQADIGAWVSVAVGWQISSKTNADLASAYGKVMADLATAQQDIAQTITAS